MGILTIFGVFAHAQLFNVLGVKGTIQQVDNSKWAQINDDIFNKNIGRVGIGTNQMVGNTLLSLKTSNNDIRHGIQLDLSGATSSATGIAINASSANVRGFLAKNSSTGISNATNFWAVGGELSSVNIASGYLAYRNSSGKTYGLYGINGTISPGGYVVQANVWAAFLRGRTVISSESSPTSDLDVDLEVRNTNGQNAAQVLLRQTSSMVTTNTELAKIGFGDNHNSKAQAQISAIRDVAGTIGTSDDLPTSLAFYTTEDGSASLTEKMRIGHNGHVGIGTSTPQNTLDIFNNTMGQSGLRLRGLPNALLQTNAQGDVVKASLYIVGEIKECVTTLMPNGWIPLDGRAVSTLTMGQQTNAGNIGLGSTLPNVPTVSLGGLTKTTYLYLGE